VVNRQLPVGPLGDAGFVTDMAVAMITGVVRRQAVPPVPTAFLPWFLPQLCFIRLKILEMLLVLVVFVLDRVPVFGIGEIKVIRYLSAFSGSVVIHYGKFSYHLGVH
jgi:hypothetical protein